MAKTTVHGGASNAAIVTFPQSQPVVTSPAEVSEVVSDTSEAFTGGEDSGEPERAECPDCGKEVTVNKDGSLRKHQCEPAE